jgi:hypothetical protein
MLTKVSLVHQPAAMAGVCSIRVTNGVQMRKKDDHDDENLDDYELFYMELPSADYLEDIEIQDEIEKPDYDRVQGLSSEQVSQIARDSLNNSHRNQSDDPEKLSAENDN